MLLVAACAGGDAVDESGESGGAEQSAGGSAGKGTAGSGGASKPDASGAGGATGGKVGSGGAGGSVASGGASGSAGNGDGGYTVVDACSGDASTGAGGASNPLGLTPGVWKDITPTDISGTFGANSIDIDPTNPLTIYASLDQRGIWKSTNGGKDWSKIGDIDSPLRVAVDPCDSSHLYATEGVRGSKQGFWVSHDGGATWVQPQGFADIASTTTRDVTTLAVDPTSFAHVLVGSHSAWPSRSDAGIIESIDGGETFRTRAPASGGFQAGSVGIGFAGDSRTWLVNGDGAGTWRTTDQGDTWTKVSDLSGTHGGSDLYISAVGHLYFGGYQYPYRSTDKGVTWAQIKNGLSYSYYLGMVGDGTSIYTMPSFPDAGANYNQPYYTSLETDGTTWTPYQGGAQKFKDGPYRARFDKVNRIIYSANWIAGVWALRVIDP
jgi:hypothetical protein